jgi:F-type H+-transporting ATPase subunit alpha
MQLIYALINFLILAVGLWIVGRKTVLRRFAERRERIGRELDEAEALEAAAVLPSSEIDEPQPEDTLEGPIADADMEILRRSISEEEQQAEELHRQELEDLQREAMGNARDQAVRSLVLELGAHLTQEPQLSRIRALEPLFAERILENISITPGDMCYLMHHDVLYVTLTSAFPLPDDLVELIGKRTTALLREVGGKPSYWVKVDPDLMGGIRLRIGDTVYDMTVENRLYHLEKDLTKRPIDKLLDKESILQDLMEGIEEAQPKLDTFQLGRVISVSDGICWLDGLADIMYGEVVEFDCGERGMILEIDPQRIGCVVFGSYEMIESGSRVRRVGRIASVPVGEALLGRVVDPLGRAIDGKGRIRTELKRPIENPAPGIPDRKSISVPLHTGVKAVDALVPIGRGQRELIIGDRQTGKTALLLDAIINQRGKNVACIYVAIGQKETSVAEFRDKLVKYGAMSYTTIVSAPASSSASLQYIAPFAGAAMSEYFLYSGRDCLIIYDDLSKHAVAYRELSLLLHRPSGREAYPGDVFYLHSRLLERAARLSEEAGGGSVTALPVIETQMGDISAYIPTNVISITDGQIFLETDLFNSGQRPAINVGLSVSRVGSAAQTPLMKQVSSRLRMELAQYRELSTFAQFGSDLDDDTRKVLNSGERMMAALRQRRYAPLEDWKQALLLFAVSEGFADDVDPENMEEFEDRLYFHMEGREPELVQKLKSGKKMDAALISSVKDALTRFRKEDNSYGDLG